MEDPRTPQSSALADLFCHLAAIGPQALSAQALPGHLAGRPAAERAVAPALLDPARRTEVSRAIGAELADRLARADGKARLPIPALLAADAANGWSVVSHLAAAARGRSAVAVAGMLQEAAVAEARALANARSGDPAKASWAIEQLRCAMAGLSVLELADAARCRLFVALADSMDDSDALATLARTPLFPATPDECATVLAMGGDGAVRTVLLGAGARMNGWAVLSSACRILAGGGTSQALPALVRIHRIMSALPRDLQLATREIRGSLVRSVRALAAA